MSTARIIGYWWWQAWIAAVVFVYPLPGTIALRNLLLLAGLMFLVATWRQGLVPVASNHLRNAGVALAVTTAWLVGHCLLFAKDPMLALANMRGDWLQPILVLLLSAFAASRIKQVIPIRTAAIALSAHIAWVIGWQFIHWWSARGFGPWPVVMVPFAQNDHQSSLDGFLLALLIADRIAGLLSRNSNCALPARQSWTMLGLGLLGDIVLRVRNGTVTTLALISVATILHGQRTRRLIPMFAIAGVIAASSAHLDRRWSDLRESISIGWTSSSRYWLGFEESIRPRLASSAVVEQSAYARAAWARQALDAIVEHPLGLGFGRDAFGRAVELKYGHKGMVSSHSGWLDFALAAGIPGLALLLLTAALAIRGGWRQFRAHDDPAGLMFSFLVGGYMLRCLLDGHMSGWRLGLFAFLCGVLIAAMKPAPKTP